MARDGLLLDVADAVASNQQVDWDRARHAARVDQRRPLDSLRDLSRMFGAAGGLQDAASSRHHPAGDSSGTSFLRFAIGALVAVAALQVVAALVEAPWRWGDLVREAVCRATNADSRFPVSLRAAVAHRRSSRPSGAPVGRRVRAGRIVVPLPRCHGRRFRHLLLGSIHGSCPRSSSRRSCGRSPGSFRGSIDEPASTIWRGGWCPSARGSAAGS